jgi:hypothetical protein
VDGPDVVQAAAAQSHDGDADPVVRSEYVPGLKRGDSSGARLQKISSIDID